MNCVFDVGGMDMMIIDSSTYMTTENHSNQQIKLYEVHCRYKAFWYNA